MDVRQRSESELLGNSIEKIITVASAQLQDVLSHLVLRNLFSYLPF